MTSEPRRLLAVAISPLSFAGGTAPSAIEVVHNLGLTRSGGGALRGEARLRLAGDRTTITLSMRDSGVGRGAVEIWKLTDRPSNRGREAQSVSPSGFIVVVLQRLQDAGEQGSFELAFDLSQAGTMSGSIDVSDLRRLGFNVAGAGTSYVEGLAFGPAVREEPAAVRQSPPARPRRRSSAAEGAARRRSQPSLRQAKLHTGSFATRRELTAQIWALQRQQVFPNLAAIARVCETSPDVVRAVVEKQEGLETYLQTGCLLG